MAAQTNLDHCVKMEYEYQFIKVDRNGADIQEAASNYRGLRLEALRQSPTAFSSTIEVESKFPDELWLSRLQDPEKETFACVATTPDGTSEWVAQVTLRGPISASEFIPPQGSGQAEVLPDEEEEKWQMLSLYTLPSHRGKKLGQRLCQSTFDFLKSRKETVAKRTVVRIMVKPENTVTLKLYGGLGFERAGLCTLEEALRANGDNDLIPSGELSERYTTRSGIVMLLRLDRST